LLHTFLGIDSFDGLEGHPKLGASWEGFALEQVLHVIGGEPYFWATHSGAELDLMVQRRGKRWVFEFKYSDAPVMSKSMHVALSDLKLERILVAYAGNEAYPVHGQAEALPLTQIYQRLESLGLSNTGAVTSRKKAAEKIIGAGRSLAAWIEPCVRHPAGYIGLCRGSEARPCHSWITPSPSVTMRFRRETTALILIHATGRRAALDPNSNFNMDGAGTESRAALDRLFSLTYEELRRLASTVRRGDPSQTMNTTVLLHEAWVKLARFPEFASTSPLPCRRDLQDGI
jgi:hypothetical protein